MNLSIASQPTATTTSPLAWFFIGAGVFFLIDKVSLYLMWLNYGALEGRKSKKLFLTSIFKDIILLIALIVLYFVFGR